MFHGSTLPTESYILQLRRLLSVCVRGTWRNGDPEEGLKISSEKTEAHGFLRASDLSVAEESELLKDAQGDAHKEPLRKKRRKLSKGQRWGAAQDYSLQSQPPGSERPPTSPLHSITSSHPTPPPPGIVAQARSKLALLCSAPAPTASVGSGDAGPEGSVMSCSRPCVCSHGTSVEESTWYGFDFYPNLFYNDWLGTTTLPYNPERIPIRYINRPWPSLCWKVTVAVASLFLLLGVAALTTGYAVPPKLELVNESKFSSMEDPVADYNQALMTCRVVGATLCGVAGIMLAVCLFLIASGWMFQDIKAEPLVTETDSPVEVFRDEPEKLSPAFHETSSQSPFLTPPSPFGQQSVQTSQPQRDL